MSGPHQGPPPSGAAEASPVWVGDSAGAELAVLAAGGQASAMLVLSADITVGPATQTVWGWLEGSGNTGQNIINTRTDGPNAAEENGGLGLIALAQHLAGLPSRHRDMYFALVTGHFQLLQFSAPSSTPPTPRSAPPPSACGWPTTWTSPRPPCSA